MNELYGILVGIALLIVSVAGLINAMAIDSLENRVEVLEQQ